MPGLGRSRLLLLLPTTTYRAGAFMAAADALKTQLTVASEADSAFSADEPDKLLTLDFADPTRASARAVEFHRQYPIDAVFGVDDRTALVAAHIADALSLPHNSVNAVAAAGDKFRQRQCLAAAGLPVPNFERFQADQSDYGNRASRDFPLVVKPVSLSGSRGVIRADNYEELEGAIDRLRPILMEAAPQDERAFLIEDFVPGPEFALEGLLDGGRLTTLALFDKPDPLNGPCFAETIYLTPSRAPQEVQRGLATTAQAACTALGLTRGPVHVELRHNALGTWLIELAARPIGGRCGQVLRFGASGETSLETVLLGHALGGAMPAPVREHAASGVMMLPVPRRGTFREVRHLEAALAVPGVTDVAITIHRGATVRPLPEEARYLGFIFARAPEPGAVEQALRQALRLLDIDIQQD